MKKVIVLICLLLMMSGCSSTHENIKQDSEIKKMFTDRDLDETYGDYVSIILDNDESSCDDSSVIISNKVITITQENTYMISGHLDEGMIMIDCDQNDKLHLVLNNVSINHSTSAPIYIKQADKVVITLVNDNTLTHKGEFVSKDDLSFNGSGSLSIECDGGHGIVGKDDLVFINGQYEIHSSSHGISANDSIRIKNGNFNIDSGKDGMKCENEEDTSVGFVYIENGSFSIESEGDGISASSDATIIDGSFDLLCGGGYVNGEQITSENYGGFMGGDHRRPGMNPNGMIRPDEITDTTQTNDSASIKGIKANNNLIIENGTFSIDSADDALHCNNDLTIVNGLFDISTGDDGLHADQTLNIKNCTMTIKESYEGLEGTMIYIDKGTINIKSNDDGLNAAGGNDQSGFGHRQDKFSTSNQSTIEINDGILYINAEGDGIDSNGNLVINGGEIIVEGPTNGGNGALDFQNEGIINGGEVCISGSIGMAQTFSSSSKQATLAINTGTQKAGSIIEVLRDNQVIYTRTINKDYSCVIISTPQLKKNTAYTLRIGDQSGEIEAY